MFLFLILPAAAYAKMQTGRKRYKKKSLEKTIFTAKETQKISEFNRDILLVIALAFLFVNIWLYNISKEEGEDLESYKLQIVASILTVIAALIALYVVRNPADRGQIVDVENPII